MGEHASDFAIENVTVDYQGMDSQQWTERRLVAQDGPDLLFGNWTYLIEKWMEAGLVNFYDDYLVQPNPYVAGNEHWRDQFIVPSARQSNGSIAWLGLDNTTLWFFYNKPMFANLGIEPPATWPEMIEMFQTIQDAGIIPCSMYHNLASLSGPSTPPPTRSCTICLEITAGSGFEPTAAEVARFVQEGKYNVTNPEYQDSFRIATDWWQYTPKGAFSGGDDQGTSSSSPARRLPATPACGRMAASSGTCRMPRIPSSGPLSHPHHPQVDVALRHGEGTQGRVRGRLPALPDPGLQQRCQAGRHDGLADVPVRA